jgi:alpha-mannosidase
LADGWILLLMNTDRNVLWGSAGGEPFLSKQAWNVEDRYHTLHAMSQDAVTKSLQVLTQGGDGLVAFNSLNWRRSDPLEFRLAAGKRLAGRVCEVDPESPGTLICQADLGPLGLTSLELEAAEPEHLKEIALPEEIENDYYIARLDPKLGALVSLKVKPHRNELLGGAANVLVAEDAISALKKAPTSGADFLAPRPERKVLARSTDFPPHLRALRGPLSTLVAIASDFYGGARLEQRVRFYHQYPRIDFDVRLDLHTQDVLIAADFPLLSDVVERTRGIPYGFESRDPRHPFVPPQYHMTFEEALIGYTETILPAIRWSAYRQARPGGLAILDRGLPMREVHGSLVILGLVNAVSSYHKYPNELLNSQGWNVFSYALVPYPGSWQEAAIPRLAYEFNAAVLTRVESAVKPEMQFVTTSPNVIVEAMRRLHDQIELRLYEWQGQAGEAEVSMHLPHSRAVKTNLIGTRTETLSEAPTYKIQVRPQEIVTLRFSVDSSVAEPEPLRSWERLVPAHKRQYLAKRMTASGHAGVFK